MLTPGKRKAPLREGDKGLLLRGSAAAGTGGPPAGGTRSGVVSPLRRRVTLPTAAKSPKRRLETKVSKTFLCLLRGTSLFRRRVKLGLTFFPRRSAGQVVADSRFAEPAHAGPQQQPLAGPALLSGPLAQTFLRKPSPAAPRRGKDQACLQTSRAQNYPDFGLERQRAAARRQVKFPPAPVSSAWPGFVVPRKWGSGDCAVAQWELCVRCPRQFFGDFLIAQKVTRPAGRNLPCRLGGKIRNQ